MYGFELKNVSLAKENHAAVANYRPTQGNYATQDSSGMCHLMPRRHLPEWREEDELAFVHCGSSNLNHPIASNRVCQCHSSLL